MSELTMCMAGAILLLVVVGAWCVHEILQLRWKLDKYNEALADYLEAEHREFLKSIHEPGWIDSKEDDNEDGTDIDKGL